MKIILRVSLILLVGLLVSGALYLAVEKTNLFSDANTAGEIEQQPALSGDEAAQLPVPSEGPADHHSASLERGSSEVLTSLGKLSGITALVLLVQVLFTRFHNRRTVKTQVG